MLKATALLALLICPIAAIAGEPDINDYAQRSKAARKQLLAELQEKLPKLRKELKVSSRRDLSRITPEPARYLITLKEGIADAERTISKISNPWQPYFMPLSPGSTKVGDIGSVDGWFEGKPALLRVVQVIDSNNVLVEYEIRGDPGRTVQDGRGRFRIGTTTGDSTLYWLRTPTTGVTDGKTLPLKGIYAITTTKTYPTADGTKTVPELEPVDVEPHREKFTLASEARTWTVRGKPVEAILVDHTRTILTLVSREGKTIKVRHRNVSEEDLEHLRSTENKSESPMTTP